MGFDVSIDRVKIDPAVFSVAEKATGRMLGSIRQGRGVTGSWKMAECWHAHDLGGRHLGRYWNRGAAAYAVELAYRRTTHQPSTTETNP